jgi:Cation efflux family
MPPAVKWLQGITLGWMTVECAMALAFGADSLIELLSAVVVLLTFAPWLQGKREWTERAAAVLLFALAAAVVMIAVLERGAPRETSRLGMAVTAAALVVMPGLAWLKRREARKLGNAALRADAAQSATCAYLAAVTLMGLAAFAIWRVAWVDSAAALLAVPLLVMEGRRTWRGEGCGCAG